jgi:tetratricopeptide (TPR) repeat protein
MTLKAFRLLLIVAAVTLVVCLMVKLNPGVITLNYGLSPGLTLTAPLGLIVFFAFLAGGILLGIIYSLSNLALRLRISSMQAEQKWLLASWARLREINGLIAIGELDGAERELHTELRGKTKITELRVLLAKVKSQMGKDAEAMLILDGLRADEQSDNEVLWMIADLHRKTGNRTTEVDFLSRILSTTPRCRAALERIVTALISLKDYSRAIFYQQTICSICTSQLDLEREQQQLATLELSNLENQPLSPTERIAKLDALLRDHRDFPPALNALAKVKVELADIDGASRLYYRSFVAAPAIDPLIGISTIYLKASKPDDAISALRSCVAKAPRFLKGRIFLAALLIKLEAWDEARRELMEAKAFATTSEETPRLELLLSICNERMTPSPKNIQTLSATLSSVFKGEELFWLNPAPNTP